MYCLMLILPLFLAGSVTSTNYIDIFTNLAGLGPLAVAVGLTMILGEFDISSVSIYGLGGVIALKVGQADGLLLACVLAGAAGALLGAFQGAIVARLKISSVPVTLGGFLAIWGLTEVIAGHNGKQLASTLYGPSEVLNETVGGVFTVASLIVIGGVLIVHGVFVLTRLGRNVRAVGGDRRASAISGINVPVTITMTFLSAGAIAALGGALQALSFSTVSPQINFNPLLMAVIAAIVGGVGITGATGSPLGIACGVLSLGILQELFGILEVNPDLATVLTGAFLTLIAIISAPDLRIPAAWRSGVLSPLLERRSKESALDPSGS
jgi:ribose/xylose/arabinose/galactoside ABC-type transport system permease subunit